MINFQFYLNNFFSIKNYINLKLNYSDFLFKLLIDFNFLLYRSIFFNIKKFFNNINLWNINFLKI